MISNSPILVLTVWNIPGSTWSAWPGHEFESAFAQISLVDGDGNGEGGLSDMDVELLG